MNLFAKQKQIDIDTYGYQREKWGEIKSGACINVHILLYIR